MLSTRRISLFMWCLSILLFFAASLYAEVESSPDEVKQETGMYYTIQKGDTLWDLSMHFYDSPLVWPDLWYQNKDIANPHRIYPGERIRLYSKEWVNKRSQRVVTEEKQIQPNPMAVVEPAVVAKPEPEPIVVAEAPATETVPSQPQEAPKKYYTYSEIDSVGYMLYETPAVRAKNHKDNLKNSDKAYIYKVREAAKAMISEGDLVYIRQPGDEPLTLGSKYTVYRTAERRSHETTNYIGTEYIMVGIVEILRSSSPGYYEANVIQAFSYMEVYDFLMPYHKRDPHIELVDLPESGTVPRLTGKIIAGQNNTAMFSSDCIAYIDKGTDDGVKIGEEFTVFYQENEKDPVTKKEIPLTPVSYGDLLVLLTTPKTSTVLITSAKKDIYQNALFATKFSDL